MDTPMNNVATIESDNIEIKSERIDIIEVDDQIFTNGGCFDDDSQELNNVGCSEKFNAYDDQFIIEEEIICKEEPKFGDTQTNWDHSCLEPSDDGWRNEMKIYLCSIEHLIETTLQRIKQQRNRNNTPFDDSFKIFFLHKTNARATTVYENFMKKENFDEIETVSNRNQNPSFHSSAPLTLDDIIPRIDPAIIRNDQVSIHLEQSRLQVSVDSISSPLFQKSNRSISVPQNQPVTNVSSKLQEKSVNQGVNEGITEKSMENVVDKSQQITKWINENSSASENVENKRKLKRKKPTKQLKCKFCEFSTVYRSTLTRHTRTHTGERPFRCEICQKSFTEQTSLRRHTKMHGQLFPYQCSNCRQGFAQKDSMDLHAKGCKIKQYECYVCNKKFHQNHVNLVVHMHRKHTGERPFTCSKCGMQFVQSSHLKRHTKCCRKKDND